MNHSDLASIENLSNSATCRTILNMNISKDEQAKSKSIVTLCEFADRGALVFTNSTEKNAFFTLLAIALHEELNVGGEA